MRYRKTSRRKRPTQLYPLLRGSLNSLPIGQQMMLSQILRDAGLVSALGRYQRRVITPRGALIFEEARLKGW